MPFNGFYHVCKATVLCHRSPKSVRTDYGAGEILKINLKKLPSSNEKHNS